MNYNKIVILGRVGRDPEIKALPSGSKVCSFSVATTRTWKNKETGEVHEDTEWHNVVFFNKPAEVIAQYIRKGSLILVDGHNQTRSWDDKETGKKVYRTEIIGEGFQLPPKGMSGTSEAPDNSLDNFDGPDDQPVKKQKNSFKANSSLKKKVESVQQGNLEYPEEQINAEDIPF